MQWASKILWEHLNSNAIILQHSFPEFSTFTVSQERVLAVQILISAIAFSHNLELCLAFLYSLPGHTPGVTVFVSPHVVCIHGEKAPHRPLPILSVNTFPWKSAGFLSDWYRSVGGGSFCTTWGVASSLSSWWNVAQSKGRKEHFGYWIFNSGQQFNQDWDLGNGSSPLLT